MIFFVFLISAIFIVELLFKPRLDFVTDGWLLWYGKKQRKYFRIF